MTWALGGAGLDVLGTLGHFFLSTDAALQSRRRAKRRGCALVWLAGCLAGGPASALLWPSVVATCRRAEVQCGVVRCPLPTVGPVRARA